MSAVDAYEHGALAEQIKSVEIKGPVIVNQRQIFPGANGYDTAAGEVVEYKPHFHEWATALPGMICLSRKKKTSMFRNYTAAETAAPVIACCAGF